LRVSPRKGDEETPAIAAHHRHRQHTLLDMAKTPLFWLIYVMFVMTAAGGLMATAQLAPIANDFGVAEKSASFFGFTLPALTFALSIDRVLNGLIRPFFGCVSESDRSRDHDVTPTSSSRLEQRRCSNSIARRIAGRFRPRKDVARRMGSAPPPPVCSRGRGTKEPISLHDVVAADCSRATP
jgi:hypothetical protein